eukprot:1385271-Amorphochlora_amoeboformis.AAC.1
MTNNVQVMNGMEYTSTNCTTTMPGDQKSTTLILTPTYSPTCILLEILDSQAKGLHFWTNVESKPSVVVGAKALRCIRVGICNYRER